jgi:hypothetical protein
MSDDERMKRVLWALDSGFEHIEIDEKKLFEGDIFPCITSGFSIKHF